MQLTRLWIIFGISLLLAAWIDYRDKKLNIIKQGQKDHAVTWILIVVLVFFCGLRIWGNDTSTYIETYEYLTPTLDEMTVNDIPSFSAGMGFAVLNIILKTIGLSSQDFLMFYALLTVIPYVLFVRRYSFNIVFGVFLMFTTDFYIFSMAAMKQSLAMGICLCALPLALDGKWVKYFLLIGLASLFHPYALIYLIVPLMMFEPWSWKTLLCIALSVAAGLMMETLIGTVLDVTDLMGAEYTKDEMLGEGINIFRVLVCCVPIGLAALYGKPLFRDAGKEIHLMFNLTMLTGLIMFIGIFGTANYFARLAYYFLPTQVVVIPWLIYSAHPKDRRWLLPACILGYLGYFYYEYGIVRPFDAGYAQMSLWDYLADLLREWIA